MASSTAYDTVKAFLQAALAPTFPVLDFDQIDSATEKGDAPFVALEEDFGEESIASFGTQAQTCIREEGGFTAHVFVLANSGLSAARTIGDLIRNAARWRQAGSGVTIMATDPPMPGFINDGRWSSVEVSLTYQRDSVEDIS